LDYFVGIDHNLARRYHRRPSMGRKTQAQQYKKMIVTSQEIYCVKFHLNPSRQISIHKKSLRFHFSFYIFAYHRCSEGANSASERIGNAV
jgi:hypothetical protein